MMNFLCLQGVLTVVLLSMAASAERQNVVILYADDWRFDTLGVAGNPVVKTPNLDALAEDGFRFTHACATTAICGVSRASLFTGQWMSRHGNRGFKPFKTPWEETYPGLLREAGYFTGHVGKWHNGSFPRERFDFGRAYSGKHWITEEGRRIHVTKKNEEDALDFLEERTEGEPFVLTLAFFAPHAEDGNSEQYLPQPESMNLYEGATIPVPKTATEEAFHKLPEFIANEKNEGRRRWHWRFDTPEKFQKMMKNYYRLVTEVDATCGRVIAELKEQGLYDNTLIIFTGDNGYYHGEHGLADKWYPHEESIRVPLIIRDPRMPEELRGKTDDRFVLNVDLAPTISSAAGIDVPGGMQGRDLAPIYLGGGVEDWRTDFFYEHPTHLNKETIPASQALVTKEWKYFYWPDFQREQLFHVSTDPFEENDVISNPENKAVLDRMRIRFEELRERAK